MKKAFVRFALLLFALALALVSAIGIFIYRLDINHYKEDLIDVFNENTGLVLDIEGDLQVEVGTSVRVVIDRFSLSDGLGMLARADAIELSLPLKWPAGALNIDRVTLSSPVYYFRTAGIQPHSTELVAYQEASLLNVRFDLDSVIVDAVDVHHGRFLLHDSDGKMKLDLTEIQVNNGFFSMKGFEDILQSFEVQADVQLPGVSAFGLHARDGYCQFTMKDGILNFNANYQRRERSELDLTLNVNPKKMRYRINGVSRGELIRDLFLNGSKEADWVSGSYTGNYDLSFTMGDSMVDLASINGRLMIESYDARVLGFDMDKMVKHFKKTQQFSFKDLGSVLLLGPWGLAISKGGDYASLAAASKKDSTKFDYVHCAFSVDSGLLAFNDVAFRTEKNRIAMMGRIDPVGMTYKSFSYALIDKDGCSIIRQEFNGPFKQAKTRGVSGFEILMGPVTNLYSSSESVILRNDCERVYSGVVEPPTKKRGLFRKRSMSQKP